MIIVMTISLMKKTSVTLLLFSLTCLHAQVGINTKNPLATLEVHRSELANVPDGIIPPRISADSLQLKDHLYGSAQNGAMIYITKPTTKSTGRTSQMTSSGYYVYDSAQTNQDKSTGAWKKMSNDPNAFAASSISPVSFTAVSAKNNFQGIQFDSAFNNETGAEYLDGNQYVVPETGLYVVNYYVNFDSLSLKMSEVPSLAIMKAGSDKGLSLLSARPFGNIVPQSGKSDLAQVTPQASVNHIYNLKKGERLSFGLIIAGGNASNFGKASSEISIYKIK